MQFETFFQQVQAKAAAVQVEVTQAQVQKHLSGYAIDPGNEIPDRLASEFANQIVGELISAITPSSSSTTLAEPAKKKGGKPARIAKASIPIDPPTPSPSELDVAQEEATNNAIEFIRESEMSRLNLVDTLVTYEQTFESRMWRDVATKIKANPPRKSQVVSQAKERWNQHLSNLRGELTEIGIELEA